MKFFIGLEDIASQVTDIQKGFSQLGIKSYSAILEKRNLIRANLVNEVIAKEDFFAHFPNHLHHRLQKLIPQSLHQFTRYRNRRKTLLREMSKECDVFIFVWESFYQDSSDLKYLKDLGKKIVVFFMGSEQRWANAFNQELERYNISSCFSSFDPNDYQFSLAALKDKLRYIRNVEKYADVIYSLPNQSQLSLRPYSHFYIPVDTEIIQENSQQREIPIIAHAPSIRAIKGTDIVLNVLERLRRENIKFETCLIENVPYFEALKKYSESDILIGELFTPSGGKLDREALAAGKVVLSSMHHDYIDNVPADCPIIDINPENLYTQLKTIIEDFPRRIELAKRGRAFVEKYHDITTVCRDILGKLENYSVTKSESDFYPDFFRQKFIPEENPAYREAYNNWTQYVSDCDWYKQFVPSGTREGLRF